MADLPSKILDARPSQGPNFFLFMQFLGKFGKIVCWWSQVGLAPLPRRNSGSATIGGSKGGRQGRMPPRGPNSFIFMQFSAKIIAILGVGAPPGENPGSATGHWLVFCICLTSVTRAKQKEKNGISCLISALCINCLSSIPEYSRIIHYSII